MSLSITRFLKHMWIIEPPFLWASIQPWIKVADWDLRLPEQERG
jgi:hypothetical protein